MSIKWGKEWKEDEYKMGKEWKEDEYKMGKEWKEVNTKWLGGPATGASLGLAHHRALRYTKELRRFDLTKEYWVYTPPGWQVAGQGRTRSRR